MAIIKYKPTSNGRRNMSGSDFAEITKTKPERLCWSAKAIQQGAMLTDTSQCVIVAVVTNSFIV